MLLASIGFEHLVEPIDLWSDSKGAISLAYNPVQRAASKHVDLADHYIRECQERGLIRVAYVKTGDMVADTLTKQLGRKEFEKHRAALGVKRCPAWAAPAE